MAEATRSMTFITMKNRLLKEINLVFNDINEIIGSVFTYIYENTNR